MPAKSLKELEEQATELFVDCALTVSKVRNLDPKDWQTGASAAEALALAVELLVGSSKQFRAFRRETKGKES